MNDEPGESGGFHTRPVRTGHRVALLALVVVLPLAALAAAIPVAWGHGLSAVDAAITAVLYLVSIAGITVGYHRHFTHRAFKARRGLRIALCLTGGLALEGSVVHWVAEHRRHHAYADQPGDPHSPWRYGESGLGVLRGVLYAQGGWFFANRDRSDFGHWAPDLLADPDLRRLTRVYPLIAAVSWLAAPALGWAATGTAHGAATAFFWGSLVRYALVHHATWSVNSIAHVYGTADLATRDRSRNVRWVALITLGEGWHNVHHADPTSARHGALPGQPDASAALIRLFERLGWAYDVRWPRPDRIAAKRIAVPPETMSCEEAGPSSAPPRHPDGPGVLTTGR